MILEARVIESFQSKMSFWEYFVEFILETKKEDIIDIIILQANLCAQSVSGIEILQGQIKLQIFLTDGVMYLTAMLSLTLLLLEISKNTALGLEQ